jgi:hypothetical protein
MKARITIKSLEFEGDAEMVPNVFGMIGAIVSGLTAEPIAAEKPIRKRKLKAIPEAEAAKHE